MISTYAPHTVRRLRLFYGWESSPGRPGGWDDQSHIQYLSRSSVQFVHDGVLLQLLASKTDPFRKGIVIPLSPSGDATCPVLALRELFNRYPTSPSAPLFSRSYGL